MVRWYRSLFFRIFLWFWSIVFIAMGAAVTTILWLEDDYYRVANRQETLLLARLMDRQRPVVAEERKLWRSLRPGWNLVTTPLDSISQLPYDIEKFADEAASRTQILFGQDGGWVMIGPVQRGGYLYVAVARKGWQGVLDDEGRWLILVVMVLVVTLLCFILAWSLTRPILRLQAAVRRLAKGDFDMSALGKKQRYDEVGELTHEVVDMAAALQRLLHSHQQLLRDVSHELRSPLTRLQIALGIARKKDNQNLLNNEHDRIERAVTQVDGLIGQMLDLARLQQQDENELHCHESSVQEYLAEWLDDADIECRAKQLTLARDWPNQPILANWDWLLMERAIDNVVRNAIRFSPQNSAIVVSLRQQNEALIIAVRDKGPGVPEEDLKRIFDAFTQVDSARDHAQGGYGIGLALVKRIIELHQGKVIATNKQPGLEVAFHLPLQQTTNKSAEKNKID